MEEEVARKREGEGGGGRGRGREREGWKTDEEEQLWREGDWKERGVRILEGEMRADRGKVRR